MHRKLVINHIAPLAAGGDGAIRVQIHVKAIMSPPHYDPPGPPGRGMIHDGTLINRGDVSQRDAKTARAAQWTMHNVRGRLNNVTVKAGELYWGRREWSADRSPGRGWRREGGHKVGPWRTRGVHYVGQ